MDVPSGTRAMVLTVSDGVAAGTRQDESGVALGDRLSQAGFVVDRATVADDRVQIESALRAGAGGHALIITTGGTGLTPRDVTPQATLAVVDYEVPGLAEAMRAAGRAQTPMADLSRGVVGVTGKTLIVNVPGSPSAALESLAALEPTLGHALETLAGPFDHDAADGIEAASESGIGVPSSSPLASAPGTPARPTTPVIPSLTPLAPPAPGDLNDPWRDLPAAPVDEDPWRDLGSGAVPDTDAERGAEPPGYDRS